MLPNSCLLRSWGHNSFLAGKNDNKAASKVLELLPGAGSECPQLLGKNLMLKWFMCPPHPKTAALQATGSAQMVCFACT